MPRGGREGARRGGGRSGRALPAARRVRPRGAVGVRDDDRPRPRRRQGRDREHGQTRPRRPGPLDPAVRRRTGDDGRSRGHARPRRPGRPRRPQLRMPRPQGDAQGRRVRPPVETRPLRRNRRGGRDSRPAGQRLAGLRDPRDRQDPHRHRRGAPHVHGRGSDRRRGGDRGAHPPRAHDRPALRGACAVGGDRRACPGDRPARVRQRGRLRGGGRPAHDVGDRMRRRGDRPRLPGTAVALQGPGRRHARLARQGPPGPGRGRGCHPPPRGAVRRALQRRRASGPQGDAQAHGLVPARFLRRGPGPRRALPGLHARGAPFPARRARPRPTPPRRRNRAPRTGRTPQKAAPARGLARFAQPHARPAGKGRPG